MIPFDLSSSVENVRGWISNFCSYRLNVRAEGISSHHTLRKICCWVKVTISRLVFGPLLLITFISQFLKLLNNIRKVLLPNISDVILASLYLRGLTFVSKPRELINSFPDLSNFYSDSKYVVFILSRLSNFNDVSKVTYLSLPLISLCFLTLRRPQFFMFTAENNSSSRVDFSSQNVFRVEQP